MGLIKRLTLGLGGSKERMPTPSITTPTSDALEQLDPFASIVSFYADDRKPMDAVRNSLAEQLKDPRAVEEVAARIEVARLAKQEQHRF